MQEYQACLISDVVTVKGDVRNITVTDINDAEFIKDTLDDEPAEKLEEVLEDAE